MNLNHGDQSTAYSDFTLAECRRALVRSDTARGVVSHCDFGEHCVTSDTAVGRGMQSGKGSVMRAEEVWADRWRRGRGTERGALRGRNSLTSVTVVVVVAAIAATVLQQASVGPQGNSFMAVATAVTATLIVALACLHFVLWRLFSDRRALWLGVARAADSGSVAMAGATTRSQPQVSMCCSSCAMVALQQR